MNAEIKALFLLLVVGYVHGVHFNACNKCYGRLPYRLHNNGGLFGARQDVPQLMREFLNNLLDLKHCVSRETSRFVETYHDGDASFLDLMTIVRQTSCLSGHRHVTDSRVLFFEKLSNLALYLDVIQTNRHRHECDVHVTQLCANDLLCKWQQVLSGLELFGHYPKPCCRRAFPDHRITSCTHLRTIVYLMLRDAGEIILHLEEEIESYLSQIDEYE